MRDLSIERNMIKVIDGVSGDTHEIFYRLPTLAEREAYQKSPIKRKGKKIVLEDMIRHRIKFGMKVITGFVKGTFGLDGKPFASDPDDPDYREDWKGLLRKQAPDIVAVVGQIAFEGTRAMSPGLDLDLGDIEEEEEEDGGENPAPLARKK